MTSAHPAAGLWVWIGFNAVVLALLALDLGVFHRRARQVSLPEAAGWSAVWVALSVAFGSWVWRDMGRDAGMAFFAGYLIEKALSVDNIFVFVLIFSAFRIPQEHQHRVLFWGILSALVMRGAMIAGGAFLIAQAHWVLYVFGAFLIVAGIRLATRRGHAIHPDRNPLLKLIGRIIPVTGEYHGPRFFVAAGDGGWRRAATPLFVSLVLVESTDLLFALDSIPAIFAVTTDPFLVYTSNVCAILGLRALYFLLAGMIHRFRYLQIGLSIVLVFVGAKMLAADVYEIPIAVSLLVIAATIGLSALASVLVPDRSIAADRSGAM